ncbi:MAG: hypothetical protein AABW59_02325 [archaeon]
MPKPRNARRIAGQAAVAARSPYFCYQLRAEAKRFKDPLLESNKYIKDALRQTRKENEAERLYKGAGLTRTVFYSSKFAKDALKRSIQMQKEQKKPKLP